MALAGWSRFKAIQDEAEGEVRSVVGNDEVGLEVYSLRQMSFGERGGVCVQDVNVNAVARREFSDCCAGASKIEDVRGGVCRSGVQIVSNGVEGQRNEAEKRFQQDCQTNRNGEPDCRAVKVFFEEDEHRLIEDMHVAISVFSRALSFVVQNGGWNVEVVENA